MAATALRRIGNSSGVILPQALLSQLGVSVGDALSVTLDKGRIVLAPSPMSARSSWSDASKAIAEAGDDQSIWPEFSNLDDTSLEWRAPPIRLWFEARSGWCRLTRRWAARSGRRALAQSFSPPEMHDYLRTVLVAPMTTGARPAPFRVSVQFEGKSGLILLDQMRALDKQRLIRRLGTVGSKTLVECLSRLGEIFFAVIVEGKRPRRGIPRDPLRSPVTGP